MRVLTLGLLAISSLLASSAAASIVLHDGRSGIVAENDWQFLDSFGRVWRIEAEGLLRRQAEWDPPLPPDSLKFWTAVRIVTMRNEFLWYDENQHAWVSLGFWSEISGIEYDVSESPVASVSPNPTTGACVVRFESSVAGPVTVEIVDASGRIVRHLLEGAHPPGEYSLRWDGQDDEGRAMPSGVYLTRVETVTGKATGRVVLAR